MEPMGLDWRAGVAMIMGFAAREVFVSSLALMYRIEESAEESVRAGLLLRMREATFEGTEKRVFTFASCLGLLFFFAVALQCFSTVAVVRKETGGWGLPLAQMLLFTGAAYAGSVILVQGLRFAGMA
jgi:ferrous iron transport protein B